MLACIHHNWPHFAAIVSVAVIVLIYLWAMDTEISPHNHDRDQ